MRVRHLAPAVSLFALVAIGAGCSSSSADPTDRSEATGSSASAIQGGSTDTGHSFAVGIIDQSAGALCSGALIAPNLVVTARHCVASVGSEQVNCATDTFGKVHSAANFGVTTDGQMSQRGKWYDVSKIVVPTDAHFCGNDLALIVLAKNVPDSEATPVTPGIEFPLTDSTHYTHSLTAIGYGITSVGAQDEGTRRIKQNIPVQCIPGDAKIDCSKLGASSSEVAKTEFIAGSGTCSGDSGSSAFEQKSFSAGTPVTMGVLSRGGESGTDCLDSVYTRLDSFADLIRSTAVDAAQAGGYTPASWTGAPPDPNATDNDGGAASGNGDQGSGDGTGDNGGGKTTTTTSSGCSVTRTGSGGPSNPVPWLAFACVGLVVAARRRRR